MLRRDPGEYQINALDRGRYLAALKKVLEEYHPIVQGIYGEWEGCPDWETDDYGKIALERLFELLGGRVHRTTEYSFKDFRERLSGEEQVSNEP